MKIARTFRLILAAALCVLPQLAWPVFDPVNDDTDIFLANPAFAQVRPNVLIVIDNSANWSQATHLPDPWATKWGGIQQSIIAIANDPTIVNSDFNVGLAFLGSESGTGNNNTGGSYIRYGIRQMTGTTSDATSNLGRFVQMVSALDGNADKSNNTQWNLTMYEIYQYFQGHQAYAGYGKVKADTGGYVYVTGQGRLALAGSPLAAGAESGSASPSNYTSPIVDACQKNFVIFLSNGKEQDPNSTAIVKTAQDNLARLTGDYPNAPTQINLTPNGEQGLWTDEYAKFMANGDCNDSFDGSQNVVTYTIDVIPDDAAHTAMLQSMALNGKGKYCAVTDTSSTAQLQNCFKDTFKEVQAVNSVFASTTLPVSVNVRGTNLNQVYIGVFRPDQTKLPKWLGNLKLYKLGVSAATGSLFLADATGSPAENASTGFISGNASSYWTATSTYWGFRPASQNGVGGSSDKPDGDLVEKGGAAQRIRVAYPTSQATRNLYTCVNATFDGPCAAGTALSTKPFDNTQVTAADLGAFKTYAVASLGSTASLATLTLSAAPNPVWAIGDRVKIDGATPSNYNGTFALTAADNLTFTYTFTLPSAPDATTAQATGANHGLNTGDLITITGAGLFNTPVGDAVVTRLGPNDFTYSTGAAVTGQTTVATATGKKTLSTLTGSGTTATAGFGVGQNHGYTTSTSIVISGATETMFNTPSGASITVGSDPTSFTYSTTSTISGTQSVAQVSAAAHNLSNGQSNVYILGNNNSSGTATAYNSGPITVTRASADVVTFSTTSTDVGTDTGVIGVQITGVAHPNGTGGGSGTNCGQRDDTVFTTNGNHNITGPFNYAVTITGGTGTFAVYNGSWVVQAQADAPVSPGNTITLHQSSSANNVSGNCNFDSGGTGTPPSTMVIGKPIALPSPAVGGIKPVTTATGSPIRAAKSISLTRITALSTATGSMTAGRAADGDNTLRDGIIAWTRGADNLVIPNENSTTDTSPYGSDIRPSAHGDVLHSRPAVVNYNRYGDDNDIYAFYGSNDGVFHALKGGIANHTTGADTALNPGTERWGFIPREFFSHLKRLRDQSPAISNINQKDYFADGSIGIYAKDAKGNGDTSTPLNCVPGSCSGLDTVSGIFGDNIHPISGDKVYLYMSMRRGGDFMYALDVTNPAAPKLLWRKSSADTDDGWGQLGQSWSEPKIAKLKANIGNTNNPENIVLIFGAGYDDTVEDINSCLLSSSTLSAVVQKAIGAGSVTYTAAGSCTISGATGSTTSFTRSKGRAIFVVDAFDGTVIWQASAGVTTGTTTAASGRTVKNLNVPDMSCAIPADVTVLDKNRDGFADRVYVGDTCGQMWRLDISDVSLDEWVATKIAAISSTTDTDIANKRKFLFPPDLVFGTDATGNYTAVLLGTGDREHPFSTVVSNRFYMFKDRDGSGQSGATNSSSTKITGFASPGPTGSPLSDTDVFDATSTVLVDGTNALGLKGWKIVLGAGEKVVSNATTVSGTTFFNTNQPSSTAGGTSGTSCTSNLGVAREYLVGFADAAATTDVNGVGGITIADRSTIHAGGGYLPSPVPVVVEIDGKKYQAVISGTSVQTPPGLTLEKRTRSYWYKEVD